MITLSKTASQFVLYAKGHFAKGDTMTDLRRLVCDWACCDPTRPDQVSDQSVVNVLLQVVREAQQPIDPMQLLDRVLFGRFASDQEDTPVKRTCAYLLDVLHLMPVLDRGEPVVHLEPADYSILPAPQR